MSGGCSPVAELREEDPLATLRRLGGLADEDACATKRPPGPDQRSLQPHSVLDDIVASRRFATARPEHPAVAVFVDEGAVGWAVRILVYQEPRQGPHADCNRVLRLAAAAGQALRAACLVRGRSLDRREPEQTVRSDELSFPGIRLNFES